MPAPTRTFFRLLTRSVSAAAIAAVFYAPFAQGAILPAERDGVWAQTYSDIKADPDVRFGRLANGMRYAIMHNATPPGQVSIRLDMATGSLAETDAQQGLAHFLEHMAFKGSTHVPEGEILKKLERLGLAFGADTNAYTAQDQTVYMFDLPKADAESIDTGLMLTRETASELTLAQPAMDKERGVVLSEERLRDTPAYRANVAQAKFILKDMLAPKRFPIGKVDVIKTAPASELAAYYHAHYRPERATLIIVGDVDVDAIETKIKTVFADWRNPTHAPANPNMGRVAKRATEARVAVEPGAPFEIDLDWLNPYDDTADTKAGRRRDMVRSVALGILEHRFSYAAHQPEPPFQRADASRGNAYKSADVAELTIQATPATWKTALTAAETLRRQAVELGVRQDEVDRVITEARTDQQAAADRAATRRSPSLASAIQSAADHDDVFTSPGQNLALFEEDVKGLNAAEVNAALKTIFTGSGPFVFVATPEPIAGGEQAVLTALREADRAPLEAAVAEVHKTWPYDNFGTPGHEKTRQTLDDLGVTFIQFDNGVALTVKPTTFTRDQVLVNVRVGSGLQSLTREQASALWAIPAFINGGLKALSQEDIRLIFTDKIASASFGVGEDTFDLHGATRPADLNSQMQLLAAYMTAPGYRPEAFERVRTAYKTHLEQISATPGGVLGHQLSQLDHDGDNRWHQPDQADLDATKLSDLQSLLEGPLNHGPIEVVLVGDITVDQASAAVAATFGALPTRPPVTASVRPAHFPGPSPEPYLLKHSGRDDQAMALLAWPTDDFYSDPQQARAVRLAEQILRLRLIDEFRINEGNTYSPATEFEASEVFPHYGFVMAQVETPPPKIPQFYAEVTKIAADMREHGVTADELERARKPRVEALQRAQETNSYWAAALGGAQADSRRLDAIRMTVAGMLKVTAEDIKRAAVRYLNDAGAWKVAVVPDKPL